MRVTGRIWVAAGVLVGIALVLTACGGDDGGGAATTKAEWQEAHGDDVAALGRELDATDATLNGSERQAIQGACNLLEESATSVRESALPVPDEAVDRALNDALDTTDAAVDACLDGVRTGMADDVEAAMELMSEARVAFDAAEAAIAAWS